MESLQKDKRTGRPKIWLYRDKETNEPKGDATVTYEDPHAALAAVEWFNNKDFHGSTIGVYIAESKNKDDQAINPVGESLVSDNVGGVEESLADVNEGSGRGRGRNETSGKAWKQEGDWMCTNTSCNNVNFAFRGACNRCGTARPAGAPGAAGGGGRGKGRGGQDTESAGHPGGGLFGPNDWPCPMCANINWAKRNKCNICNTNKPGTSEGGVRGGRGGGYKELDEEELEETKRRRREAEDDGELYDEFGNLKKKFRAKAQQTEAPRVLPGSGRAGWEVEELGIDRDARERSRDRGREHNNGDNRHRERNDKERQRSRSRERDRGRDHDWDYDDRGRDYGRDREGSRRRY
ncbi:PREDICTED: transcription initiation factor TFIID subunit 15-like isoform X2 [Lupinus angustifolius]|uniref:transcription initiation factor TFIID subunit 15-like isoform X2 n=1 Tax=Lupinus angustifolius TaxID=3871 RepID=UPI00092EB505|nr:PREDICTED: transcription initiation factor TFIID subunit 15-like isoform X2 [Lupinus angustifolius]